VLPDGDHHDRARSKVPYGDVMTSRDYDEIRPRRQPCVPTRSVAEWISSNRASHHVAVGHFDRAPIVVVAVGQHHEDEEGNDRQEAAEPADQRPPALARR